MKIVAVLALCFLMVFQTHADCLIASKEGMILTRRSVDPVKAAPFLEKRLGYKVTRANFCQASLAAMKKAMGGKDPQGFNCKCS